MSHEIEHSHAADHVDCSQTMYRIMEYLDGEMTTGDMTRIAEHLDACGPCLAEHDLEMMIKSIVKRACHAEHAPPALRTTILQSYSSYRTSDGAYVEERTEIRYDER